MSADVVTEMNRLWSELRKGIESLTAQSPEANIEKFLDRVVVLRGVEFQSVYPDLEEVDDEADATTTKAARRSNKVQKAMEKLSLPPSEKAWTAFTTALVEHLEESPKDIGERLEALSKEDRADLGERAKMAREMLS